MAWLSSPPVVHGIALALDENDRRSQVLKLVRVAVHLDPEDRTRPGHPFEPASTENPAAVHEPRAAGVGVVGEDHVCGCDSLLALLCGR